MVRQGSGGMGFHFNEKFHELTNKIHSANNIDEILLKLKDEVLGNFEAMGITIYAVDPVKNELYSKVLEGSEIKSIRVPISTKSIAGYTAYSLETVNILDVNDPSVLKKINPNIRFDNRWDQKSGFTTKQILACPIRFENRLFGVLQLINKIDGGAFSAEDERKIKEISRILGIAFRNQARMLTSNFNHLVSNNIITEEELKSAIVMARNEKKELESILMDAYKVQKKDVGAAIGQFFGCRFIEYSEDSINIPSDIAKGLNFLYLKRSLWVPVSVDRSKAVIAMTKPLEMKTMEIKNVIKAADYEFVVALKEDILKFIQTLEKTVMDNTTNIEALVVDDVKQEQEAEQKEVLSELTANAAARLVNQIVIEGFEKGATDIHIEPSRTKKIVDIRFRIDGVCSKQFEIPFNQAGTLITKIKTMAGMDTTQRHFPQEGKLRFSYKKRPLELKAFCVPTIFGEDVVMKILNIRAPVELDNLMLSKDNLAKVKNMLSKPQGLILVSGSVNSGRKTSIHSMLNFINKPEIKIWTVENNVQILQHGLRQIEINQDSDFNFAKAIKTFLRADPDVIMVSETKDYETTDAVLEAALTGHFVISAFHAKNAVNTLTRLIDMGFASYDLAETILGILAQRLVRKLCGKCKEPYQTNGDNIKQIINNHCPNYFSQSSEVDLKDNLTIYKPRGCDYCNKSGYKGQIPVHELLVVSETMKAVISDKKVTGEQIKEQAVKDGFKTMFQDVLEKALNGDTDINQIKSVIY